LKATGNLAVDSNAVIAYRDGIIEVCTVIESAGKLFLPVIVLGELMYGALNSSRKEENELAVRKFLEHSILLPVDENVAEIYSGVRLKLKQSGRPMPENDIWIAAICLEHNLALLSRDKHFSFIDGLNIINWDTEKQKKNS